MPIRARKYGLEDIAMSANKPAANAPKTVVADDPDDRKGRLKNIGGSQSDHWNNIVANQALKALWLNNSSPEERDKQLSATVAAHDAQTFTAIKADGP